MGMCFPAKNLQPANIRASTWNIRTCFEDDITFNQRIYVAYTDMHYVMEMYAASDVSKEDALKIAENVKLIPVDDTDHEDFCSCSGPGSLYQDSADTRPEGEGCETVTSVAAAEMSNTHKPGDIFPIGDQGLTAKVADVKISNDLSLLDAAWTDAELKEETDESGSLRPATIQYLKTGGTDDLSREISSREIPQKLVYVTVEYQNTGSEDMTDVLFSEVWHGSGKRADRCRSYRKKRLQTTKRGIWQSITACPPSMR